jgi:hypothetical protein
MKELNRRQFFNLLIVSSVTAVGAAVVSATQKAFAVIPEDVCGISLTSTSKLVHAKRSVSVPEQQFDPANSLAQYGSIRRQSRRRKRRRARRVRRRTG